MIIVLDLERTCWENKTELDIPEIIEIGAVKLDLYTKEIIDQYQSYVKPRAKILSDYCQDLTGITMEDIKDARKFNEVYPKFINWCGSKHDYILAAWGRDDIALKKDIDHYGLQWRLSNEYINIARLYKEKRGRAGNHSVSNALKCESLEFIGTPHKAGIDAYNAARILVLL